MQKGFTLIEVILVTGLFLLISTSVPTLGSSLLFSNKVDNFRRYLVSSLRKAQFYAIANKDDAVWGVCQTGNIVRLFSGSCLSPITKDDYQIPDNTQLSGLSTITFSPLRGEPSSAVTITITSGGETENININILGGIDLL